MILVRGRQGGQSQERQSGDVEAEMGRRCSAGFEDGGGAASQGMLASLEAGQGRETGPLGPPEECSCVTPFRPLTSRAVQEGVQAALSPSGGGSDSQQGQKLTQLYPGHPAAPVPSFPVLTP